MESRFTVSQSVIDGLFIVTTPLVLAVGVTGLAALIWRRKHAPLHVRRMDLVVLSQVLILSHILWNGLNEISSVHMLCLTRRLVEPMHVLGIANVYVARLWMIWIAHSRQRAASSLKKAAPFRLKVLYVSTWWRGWMWLAVTALESIPFVVNVIVTKSLRHYPNAEGECGGLWSECYKFVLIIIYGSMFCWASYKFVDLNDEFSVKSELRACGLAVLATILTHVVLKMFGAQVHFPANDVSEMCLLVVIFSLSTLVPTWKTFKAVPTHSAEDRWGVRRSLRDQLLDLIANPGSREAFKQHLMREFSVENLMFYDAAVNFRRMADGPVKDRAALRTVALQVYDTYVKPGSDNEINISSFQRKDITQHIATNDVPEADVFECAAEEILKLMATDSLRRYRQSKFNRK
eukprot:205414_1